MSGRTILEFVNKHCKEGKHHDCAGKWIGFGFEVVCSCLCHSSKKLEALEVVLHPATIATKIIQSPEEEYSQDVDKGYETGCVSHATGITNASNANDCGRRRHVCPGHNIVQLEKELVWPRPYPIYSVDLTGMIP